MGIIDSVSSLVALFPKGKPGFEDCGGDGLDPAVAAAAGYLAGLGRKVVLLENGPLPGEPAEEGLVPTEVALFVKELGVLRRIWGGVGGKDGQPLMDAGEEDLLKGRVGVEGCAKCCELGGESLAPLDAGGVRAAEDVAVVLVGGVAQWTRAWEARGIFVDKFARREHIVA